MGINDAGVAIGNEAIFSRRATLKPGLLGMDLVRLGLERAGGAEAAVEVITALLERYGQGGAAGHHDQRFCYDSSFIVADPREAWVLETAGRSWAARRVESHAAISNALTIRRDYTHASTDVADARDDFARRFDTRLMPRFARSYARRARSLADLRAPEPPDFARMARHLRTHAGDGEDPAKGSNADLCMHAAGFIRRHQTTGSMLARLSAHDSLAFFTGTSAPCLSIFRPAAFTGDWSVLTDGERRVEAPLWRRHELLHRRALADPSLRDRLRRTREAIEPQIFALAESAEPDARLRADQLAETWHRQALEALAGTPPPRLPHHWRRIAARDGITP